MDEAVAAAYQAVELDRAGRLTEAYDAYQLAIGQLLSAASKAADAAVKTKLTTSAEGYLKRAELLKEHFAKQRADKEAASARAAAALAAKETPAPARASAASAATNSQSGRAGRPARSAAAAKPAPRRSTATGSVKAAPARGTASSKAAAARRRSGSGARSSGTGHTGAGGGAGAGAGAGRRSRSPASASRGQPRPSRTRPGDAAAKPRRAGRSPARKPPAAKPRWGAGGGAAKRRAGAKAGAKKKKKGEKKLEMNEFEERVHAEVLSKSPGTSWDDVAGLEFAKRTLMEAVILPAKRPDIFKGLRAPPKGVLLYGPPGTGKTLLARAVATESNATFFSISASALTSKWMGEGEKLVRGMFSLARKMQPCVIFMDEVDSLLTTRRSGESDAMRRIKTEFLVQLDGAATEAEERVLVMGATNFPQQIDSAAIRRFVKRVYIPLPDAAARETLVRHLMGTLPDSLSDGDVAALVGLTDGYSGSDLKGLCAEAAMGPVRELGAAIADVDAAEDFVDASRSIRPSVNPTMLASYEAWTKEFGSA